MVTLSGSVRRTAFALVLAAVYRVGPLRGRLATRGLGRRRGSLAVWCLPLVGLARPAGTGRRPHLVTAGASSLPAGWTHPVHPLASSTNDQRLGGQGDGRMQFRVLGGRRSPPVREQVVSGGEVTLHCRQAVYPSEQAPQNPIPVTSGGGSSASPTGEEGVAIGPIAPRRPSSPPSSAHRPGPRGRGHAEARGAPTRSAGGQAAPTTEAAGGATGPMCGNMAAWHTTGSSASPRS